MRVGPHESEAAAKRAHASPMQMGKRRMNGWIRVAPEARQDQARPRRVGGQGASTPPAAAQRRAGQVAAIRRRRGARRRLVVASFWTPIHDADRACADEASAVDSRQATRAGYGQGRDSNPRWSINPILA